MNTEPWNEMDSEDCDMTPEAQRIAIAEACGWTDVKFVGADDTKWTLVGNTPDALWHKAVPDYLNDLNAMQSTVLSQDDDFITRFALEMNKAENRLHKHQWAMSAQDYADCFIAVLNSKRESTA